MDMCRKFWRWIHSCRRYTNHHSGQKYDSCVDKAQEDGGTPVNMQNLARIFKKVRDLKHTDTYQKMRKDWRASE